MTSAVTSNHKELIPSNCCTKVKSNFPSVFLFFAAIGSWLWTTGVPDSRKHTMSPRLLINLEPQTNPSTPHHHNPRFLHQMTFIGGNLCGRLLLSLFIQWLCVRSRNVAEVVFYVWRKGQRGKWKENWCVCLELKEFNSMADSKLCQWSCSSLTVLFFACVLLWF